MQTSPNLLKTARKAAGLSQEELARLSGTSRTTLSAYEHGRKSPTLLTAGRLLHQAGHELAALPVIDFVERPLPRGRTAQVPTTLPRLPVRQAFAEVVLPLHLEWSRTGQRHRLADRSERARVYEAVLREGGPLDVLTYIDGALLVDIWGELVLPKALRAAWQPTIDEARGE